jgi:hypothetical protein
MSNKTRLILGVVVILAAVFLPVIQERIPDFMIKTGWICLLLIKFFRKG